MTHQPVRYLRYTLQVVSLAFFVCLFTALAYPLGWQATALDWFSRLDPWLLISHVRWQHSIPTWGWLPLLTLAVTLLLGRVFCGWLCPFGASLMLIDKASRMILRASLKRRALRRATRLRAKILQRSRPLRYFWLLFIIVVFVLGANWVLFLTPFALLSHEIVEVLRGAVPWVLILIVVGTLFFSRIWCSVFCPTGALLSLVARQRLFGYQVSGRCTHCDKCTASCSVGADPAATGASTDGCLACGDCRAACPTKAVHWMRWTRRWPKGGTEVKADTVIDATVHRGRDRRQFLGMCVAVAVGAGLWGKVVAEAGRARAFVRPPGALPETEFAAACLRCGRCIKACSNNALRPMPIGEGLAVFETPYIIPRMANCVLCLTCQEVCPTDAIAKVPVEQVKMGTAEIDRQRCIAWSDNKLCFICGERCPRLAISGGEQNRPVVHPDKCVGCGTCEHACPVNGDGAIRVRPK